MTYRVSAIVSVWNAEKFLRHCFQDLMRQSLYERGELEIIAYNAGTRHLDDTHVLEEFAAEYRHIKVMNNVLGQYATRDTMYAVWNKGIRAASAPYITNANCDDRHAPYALEVLADELDKGADLAFGNYYCTTTQNAVWEDEWQLFLDDSVNYPGGVVPYANMPFEPSRLYQFCHFGCQPMWRKSLHDQIGYFDETFAIASDYEMWCRMVANGAKIAPVPMYLGLFYFSPKTISGADNGAHLWMENQRIKIRYKNTLGRAG